MITGGDLRQSRLDVGYKTFTISPCSDQYLSPCLEKNQLSSMLTLQPWVLLDIDLREIYG